MTSVNWKTLPLGGLSVARVCTLMGLEKGEIALLESATRKDGIPVNSETGKFSIIGCIDANETERLEYHVSSRRLLHHSGSFGTISEDQVDDVWAYLKSFMSSRQVHHGPPKSPFWGGLVGFVSYEACLDSLDVKPCSAHDNPPDACFLFIERSIVVDHVNQELHIQSLHSADAEWIDLTASLLSGPNVSPSPQLCNAAISSISQTEARAALSSVDWMPQSSISPTQVKPSEVQLISKERYCAKIRQCQEEIRAGNSYELCLTGQSTITMPRNAHRSDWDLYQQLRQHNPAPFGAYVRVQCAEGKVSILSSSPERFLNWDRNGHCQFRPVKGTVKKTSDMTYSKAQAILKSSKEQAENLMIVDLIRHDLHGVVGAGNVEVTKLMGTEEYETVYQLVSVIEGEITKSNRDGGTTGIDVLAASLPPGSMTGAPKKRSCEILRHIEDNKTRGIYSGVLGYLDVGSGGDFSVVIRTAYKWDRATTVEVADEKRAGETREFDIWTIGAGGAVTSQSTEIGEWDEMCTKRNALLHIFCPPDAAVLQGA